MAFNFRQYTSNNPLLQELDNIDQYAENGEFANEEVTVSSSGVEMGQGNKYPLIGIENAVLAAIEAGIDKQTVINIVNQTYGGVSEDYTSSEEFDYMDDDQLDAAGLTGDKIGPEN